MTPEEARDLLDGTTPAEEWWHSVKGGWVRHLEPVGIDAAGELDVSEDDAALIVAAPVLAAMIAGMREEWAREARITGSSGWFNLGWCRSRAEAELTDWTRSLPLGAMVEYRVVRRYVTEPEEA